MEEQKFNNAVILPEIGPLDFEFGGMAAIEELIIFPNGSLIDHLPEFETQANTYGDDWGCVSHSLENGGESIIDCQIEKYSVDNKNWLLENIYKNGKPNFSDRDLVVLSGTKRSIGNSGGKVLSTAQLKGLISQDFEDFDSQSRDTKYTMEYYFAYERTKEGEDKAKEWNKRFQIIGEWVHRSNWEKASKMGALQVYINANEYNYSTNTVTNTTGKYNHAVLMVDYENKKYYDTYKPEIKNIDTWNSAYEWALKINIIEKTMTKPNIANNTLVQNVTKDIPGSGQFGIFLDNKILVGEAGEVLATFYMRNNGDTKGKTKTLVAEEWDLFEKRNLKMQLI